MKVINSRLLNAYPEFIYLFTNPNKRVEYEYGYEYGYGYECE
jgi:hypothetical protein